MGRRARTGAVENDEIVVAGFAAAIIAGFTGSFFALTGSNLDTMTTIGVVLVVLGISGIAAVLIPRRTGVPDASALRNELLEITEMLEDADTIPHQEQVLWEINRATEALDQGDRDRAAEAVAAIRNLLGDG